MENLMWPESGSVGVIQEELGKEVSANSTETTKSQRQMRWLNTISQVIDSGLIKFISIKSRLSLEMNIWLMLPTSVRQVIRDAKKGRMYMLEIILCWKSFYAGKISNRNWSCQYYNHWCFLYFCSGISHNFNTPEQTFKMTWISEERVIYTLFIKFA